MTTLFNSVWNILMSFEKGRKMKAKVLALGLLCLFLSLSLLCLQFEEKEKLSKVKQKIKAIPSDESFAKYIKISEVEKYIKIPEVEDDGSMYRIWMYLLFEPRNYDQVQAWTDTVCKWSKRILNDNGVVRNISVWAIRPVQTSWEGEGGVMVYGRTLYDHLTDKFEFKRTEELNYKEEK